MKQKITFIAAAFLLLAGFQLKAQTLENFCASTWSPTAGGHYTGTNLPANAIDGNSATGWEGGFTKDQLSVSWTTAHVVSQIHLNFAGAVAGSSMPTVYTIKLYNGATLVRTVVNEFNNTQTDVVYQLPGMTKITVMYIVVTGTQAGNFPWINAFEASGPFIPEIMAPVSAQTVKMNPYAVVGYTQPGASVILTVNGTPLTAVTADAGGWFSSNATLISGSNSITGTTTLSGHTSAVSGTTTTTYNSTSPNTYALTTREGAGIAYDEGVNEVLVNAGGQGSNVAYTITDENNTVLTTGGSGTIDLSKGTALISLPASTSGWYQVVVSTTTPLTQSVSILSNRAVLPLTSPISTDVALTSASRYLAAGDAPYVVPVISDFVGKTGYGWLRDRVSWNAVNDVYGVYNWTSYDATEGALIAQGQSIMPCVYSYPDNATVNSHRDYRYVPDNVYTTYIWGQQVATHFNLPQFNGLVRGFEFQNEADYDSVSTDTVHAHTLRQTVNTLMAHQKAFYLGVKSVNPNFMVMPNPPAFVNDAANELQNLRGEAMDVFTYHWYPTGTGTACLTNLQASATGMSTAMQTVLGQLQNRAGWLSECGYNSTGPIYGTANAWSADEQIQADFLSKMGPLALSFGVDHPFAFIFPHYNVGAPGSGVLRYTNFSPQAGVNSSQITAQILQHATYYGRLNSGNSAITGLVFKVGSTTSNFSGYVLEIWSTATGGNGAYTLPNGVTFTNVADYLGRVTDPGSTTSVVVQPTAKFVNLSFNTANDTAIQAAAFTTLSTNPYPNPSTVGIAPSPVVMEFHFVPDLVCKSSPYEDYYDLPNNTTTNCYLEVVNTSTTTPFSGTIKVSTSNQRWQFGLQSGQSLTVTNLAVNGGRAYIGGTLTAPALTDTVRIEARVDDSTGQTSSAAQILQTTGSATPVNPIVEDGTGAVTIPCYVSTSGVAAANQNAPVQNGLGYDGHLTWTSGTDGGGITYQQALPSTGTVTYLSTEKFKAPLLSYTAGLQHSLTTYYVWIKAKAPSTSGIFFDVYSGVQRAAPTEINGFNTSTWTWSRTAVVGGIGGIAKFSSGTIGAGSTANYYVAAWPANDGAQVAAIVVRTDSSATPPNF